MIFVPFFVLENLQAEKWERRKPLGPPTTSAVCRMIRRKCTGQASSRIMSAGARPPCIIAGSGSNSIMNYVFGEVGLDENPGPALLLHESDYWVKRYVISSMIDSTSLHRGI